MTGSLNAASPSLTFRVTAVEDFRVADVDASLAPPIGTPEHYAVFGGRDSCLRISLGDLIKLEKVGISRLPPEMLKQAGPHQGCV